MTDGVTLDHLRTLPDGSLTRAEVNILIDYIEKLERKLGESQPCPTCGGTREVQSFTPGNLPAGIPPGPFVTRPCPDCGKSQPTEQETSDG